MELPDIPNVAGIEESLLANVLHAPALLEKTRFLTSNDFCLPLHQEIWHAITEMLARGEAVELATVKHKLNGHGAGVIDVYQRGFINPMNVPDYARAIRDNSLRRQLAESVSYTVDRLADVGVPVEETISLAMSDMAEIMTQGVDQSKSKREVVREMAKRSKLGTPCFASGIPQWDDAMGGGFYQGKLYGIAARKKHGKTLLLGSVSYHLNRCGVDHLFDSLETLPELIEQRNIGRARHFNSIKFLKHDDLTLDEHVDAYLKNEPDHTTYEYTPGISFEQLRGLLYRHVAGKKVKGFILDYLQLVGGMQKGQNLSTHYDNVAQWLSDFCRKENVFGIVAAQLNQDGNTRQGEGLRLAADQYYVLHRDEAEEEFAWLEMQESRYTFYQNVGSKTVPGLVLQKYGPHFAPYTDAPA